MSKHVFRSTVCSRTIVGSCGLPLRAWLVVHAACGHKSLVNTTAWRQELEVKGVYVAVFDLQLVGGSYSLVMYRGCGSALGLCTQASDCSLDCTVMMMIVHTRQHPVVS